MKERVVWLVLLGAGVAAGLAVVSSIITYTPNARAQGAAAASGAAEGSAPTVMVTGGPGAGVIVVSDAIGRRITAVSYVAAAGSFTNATIQLSTPRSFTY